MTAPRTTPTLVVFTLGAAADCARRPLLPARLRPLEARLRHRCLEAVLEAGRDLGCRLVVSTPNDLDLPQDVERMRQTGIGFGARLDDTLSRVARSTDGPVVVVGADSPGFTADHLRRALDRLRQRPDDVVVGPCPDGGFYLLAASGSLDGELRRVRWCDRRTLDSLRSSLATSGRAVFLLPDLADLDRRRDLEAWLAADPPADDAWKRVVRALRRALATLHRSAEDPDDSWRRAAFVPLPVNRPPPAATAVFH